MRAATHEQQAAALREPRGGGNPLRGLFPRLPHLAQTTWLLKYGISVSAG
jgi:hypothetical protein